MSEVSLIEDLRLVAADALSINTGNSRLYVHFRLEFRQASVSSMMQDPGVLHTPDGALLSVSTF